MIIRQRQRLSIHPSDIIATLTVRASHSTGVGFFNDIAVSQRVLHQSLSQLGGQVSDQAAPLTSCIGYPQITA